MLGALEEYKVVGVRTTIPVLQRVLAHAEFRAGRLSTALLEAILPAIAAAEGRQREVAMIAAVLAAHERAGRVALVPPPASDAWRRGARRGWPGSAR
jgi:acetyl/propionyl-CoA carboxylase alpha subunit